MGLLVSTRAAFLGCSTGEAERTYLMLRAALRSLNGTLRSGPLAADDGGNFAQIGYMLDRRQPQCGDLRIDRDAQQEQDQQDPEKDGAGLQAAAEAMPAFAAGIVEDEGAMVIGHEAGLSTQPIVELIHHAGTRYDNLHGAFMSMTGVAIDAVSDLYCFRDREKVSAYLERGMVARCAGAPNRICWRGV